MDPSDEGTFDEESELQAFNDPFEAVSENFVRRRHAQREEEKVSQEDEQKLLTLIDAHDLEARVLQDACAQMVMMNLVSQEVLSQVQEEFEFEKVRSSSFSPFVAHICPQFRNFHELAFVYRTFGKIYLLEILPSCLEKCNSWISPPLLPLQQKLCNK